MSGVEPILDRVCFHFGDDSKYFLEGWNILVAAFFDSSSDDYCEYINGALEEHININ